LREEKMIKSLKLLIVFGIIFLVGGDELDMDMVAINVKIIL
jgi:hypothetical protein